jgi:hypothetical protein
MMADTNAANRVAALSAKTKPVGNRRSCMRRSRHCGGEGQAANAAPGFRIVNDHGHARDPLGSLGKGDDAPVKVDVLPPQAKNLP